MMTVIDEVRDLQRGEGSKYEHLYFVEFLDFICRIALEGVRILDTVEYRVYSFLGILYGQWYEEGLMDVQDYELRMIDEFYRHD